VVRDRLADLSGWPLRQVVRAVAGLLEAFLEVAAVRLLEPLELLVERRLALRLFLRRGAAGRVAPARVELPAGLAAEPFADLLDV
jgi:hypothetical protein